MKKKERKILEVKLLVAIKKVMQDNKAVMKNKTEKTVKKSVKQIAKNFSKEKSTPSKQKIKKVAPLKRKNLQTDSKNVGT